METWLCISASRWNKTRIFDLLTTYILNTENWYASAVGAAWRVSKSPEATKADVSLSQAHTPLRRISWWIAQSPSIYWSSKSYFQKSPDFPRRGLMLARCFIFLAGHQAPPAAELKSFAGTLNPANTALGVCVELEDGPNTPDSQSCIFCHNCPSRWRNPQCFRKSGSAGATFY